MVDCSGERILPAACLGSGCGDDRNCSGSALVHHVPHRFSVDLSDRAKGLLLVNFGDFTFNQAACGIPRRSRYSEESLLRIFLRRDCAKPNTHNFSCGFFNFDLRRPRKSSAVAPIPTTSVVGSLVSTYERHGQLRKYPQLQLLY